MTMITFTRVYSITERQLRNQVVAVCKQNADEGEKLYKSVTNKFSAKNRPRYARKQEAIGKSPIDGTRDVTWAGVSSGGSSTPLVWLDVGTKVRYRTMSYGYQSMTVPSRGGSLVTRPKFGHASGWGVRKGIKPRRFSLAIAKGRRSAFTTEMRATLKDFWLTNQSRSTTRIVR